MTIETNRRYVLDVDHRLLRVAGVAFPVVDSEVTDLTLQLSQAVFHIRRARVVFENRWQISVVWGSGTYSDNHYNTLDETHEFVEEPTTVEVMVVAPDFEFAHDGEPLTRVTATEFLELVEVVRRLAHDAPASAFPSHRPGFPGPMLL